MKRRALYSRAARRRPSAPDRMKAGGDQVDLWQPEEEGPRLGALLWQRIKSFIARHDRAVPAAAAILIVFALIGGWRLLYPNPAALTQWDIDNAVKYTLGHTPQPPDNTTIAAAIVAPSVVRVDGYLSPEHAAAIAKQEADEARKNHIKLPPDPPKDAKTKDAQNKDAPDKDTQN